MITFSSQQKIRGSALIATFWLIATLGMIVFGATKFISVDGSLLEGAISNLFLATDGRLFTPAVRGGFLIVVVARSKREEAAPVGTPLATRGLVLIENVGAG